MTKYKKTVVIKAMQLKKDNIVEVERFVTDKEKKLINTEMAGWQKYEDDVIKNGMVIITLGGIKKAYIGDYIIKGESGSFYPINEDIFHKTYKKVKTKGD